MDAPGAEEAPTWIMGSSRSGSTWLLKMLSELPGVATIDDPHIGHHLAPWRPISLAYAASEEDLELRILPDVKREKESYFFSERYEHVWRPALRELLSARLRCEADEQVAPGDRHAIVVKEPGSQAAGLLLSLIPGSKLVFLLRDGRDVVDSWMDAYQRNSWAIDEGAFSVARSGRRALVRWLSSVWEYRTRAVRSAYQDLPPRRRVLVTYEDLLDDTGGNLHRICAAATIPVAEVDIRATVFGNSFDALPGREKGSGHEARVASPGLWRERLSDEEQADMHRIMGPELVRCGYSVPDSVEIEPMPVLSVSTSA